MFKGFAISVVAFVLTLGMFRVSRGSDELQIVTEIADSIRVLQPLVTEDRASMLSDIYVSAAQENNLDPKLLVAMTMRESSFRLDVESGEVVGSLGEIGLLQNHGVSVAYRPVGCSLNLETPFCQIHTGARYLRYIKSRCGSSTWVYVAAYGMRRCPSTEVAQADRSTLIAKRYYDSIGGTNW